MTQPIWKKCVSKATRSAAAGFLALSLSLAPAADAQDQVPGKHGTLNQYGVAMNDREPGGSVYHWIFVDFRMYDDGTIEAPLSLETDSMNGFCGSVQVQIRGYSNEVLDAFNSDTFCIGGKPGGHAIRSRPIPWVVKTTPAKAAAYRHLYMIPASYEQKNWLDLNTVYQVVRGVVTVIQML